MPVYTYKCENGHIVEQMSTFKDRQEEVVCSCGKQAPLTLSIPNIPTGKRNMYIMTKEEREELKGK